MNKQISKVSSICNKTNRQFYTRRKKLIQQPNDNKLQKVLKFIIKKNQQQHYPKIKYHPLQNKQQVIDKCNDKIYQLIDKRILQSNLKKINGDYTKLFKLFEKCMNSQSIEQVQSHRVNFYQQFNCIVLAEVQKNKSTKLTSQSQSKIRANKQNALFLQNRKLQKQNLLLRQQMAFPPTMQISKQLLQIQLNSSRFNNNQNIKQIKHLKTDFIHNQLTLQRKIQIINQEMEIMKRQIQTYKEQIFLLRQQKKSLKQRINEMKIKNETLCSEIIALQLNSKKIGVSQDKKQSIMMMQVQQIDSYRRQLTQIKKLYLNLNKKYKGLIIKFKKGSSQHDNKISIMYTKQTQLFPQQSQAFLQIRNKIYNPVKININPYNKQKKIDKSVVYQQFFNSKETMNNKDGIKKVYSLAMQYYNPTFYGLIAEDIAFFGIDQNNYEHFNSSIKLNFIGTLRAIMDSKYNEFLIKKQSQHCSSFPSFVLSWLNTFSINGKKKIQKICENSITTRQTICIFYANLMSQKLNYSWQIIAFRQFLLQTFNNDQLFFYLNLRRLFIGTDITRDLSYCFQQIYYVDFNKTYQLISKIIKQNDKQIKLIFQQFLKKSIIYVRKKSYLDLHHVLRILLEYYQNIKQKQIQKILKTIQMIVQNRKNTINLVDFQRIFDYHFTFLSHTQIIQLYRRCFCVGNGIVNPDIIITVLIQQNIFLKWVQPITTNDPIKIDQIQNVDWDINYIITPNLNWLYTNQQRYRFLYNTQLKRQSDSLGIQDFSKSINRIKKLDSFSIIERMQIIFQICMLFTRKFYYSSMLDNQSIKTIIQLTSEYLLNLSKITVRRNQIHELMKDLKYEAASGKIVRFYCNKKEQMMRSILYTYSSNGVMKDQGEEKCQILRTEFMQLIAKSKENLISKNCLDWIQEKL